MKLTFVDTNQLLVKKVQDLFNNQTNTFFELDTYHWDVFDYKKDNPNFLICTASNPSFSMWWWLDKAIAERYPNEICWLKEWVPNGNLLPLITVWDDLKATKNIIMRALLFVYANISSNNIILTGIGTGIGWLTEDDFIDCLRRFLIRDFSGVNWNWANLTGTNLSGVNLSWAFLTRANLSYANLTGTNLSWASLCFADLLWVNLFIAKLVGAILNWANLSYAYLRWTDITDIKYDEYTLFLAMQCPEEWDFIWWKKCKDNIIVKLKIPAEAKRSSATSRKCRAEFVEVLEVFWWDVGVSNYDNKVIYKKWEIVKCHEREEDRLIECWWWIHFFITRREAELYQI